MTNFKSGSGNLDFGSDDGDTGAESTDETDSAGGDESTAERSSQESAPEPPTESAGEDGDDYAAESRGETYPYFVRRSNVGDERDTRLEIHVRDKVAAREAQFRHDLAERLGASDVSKTDAREFALLAAFEHPEAVARLMREEGFDTLG